MKIVLFTTLFVLLNPPMLPFISVYGATKEHTLRYIRFLGWDERIENLFYDGPEGQPVKVDIPRNIRSGFFPYQGPENFSLYRLLPQEGKPAKKVTVAAARIPDDRNLSLCLAFFSEQRDRLTLYAVDESFNVFKDDTTRFINLTESPLALRVGSDEVLVAARDSVIWQFGGESDEQLQILAAANRESQGWKMAYSSVWRFYPGFRTLVFMRNTNGNQIKTSRVQENTAYAREMLDRQREE